MSITERYLQVKGLWCPFVGRGFFPCFFNYPSMFFTAACTYWEEPKVDAFTPLSSVTSLVRPPRYSSGGLIDSCFNSKYLPISSQMTFSAPSEMTRHSSTYRSTYSYYFVSSSRLDRLIQTSGSAMHEVSPSSSMHACRCIQKPLPASLPP